MIRSLPSPPSRVSAPLPPKSVSLPARPWIVSMPSPPTRLSLPLVPTMFLSACPTIVMSVAESAGAPDSFAMSVST